MNKWGYSLFAAVGACILLWQLLLPGYVLTLDMVFGPHVQAPVFSGLGAAAFPRAYLLYLMSFALSGWILQKIILFSLFFFALYLPLRFYPFDRRYHAEYFVALFYAINPFVYERLLAGQWTILYAYVFLFPFAACLVRFYSDMSWRSICQAFIWLALIATLSLHLFAMAVIVLVFFILAVAVRMLLCKEFHVLKTFLYRTCGILALLCVVSLYWVIPAFVSTSHVSVVDTFGAAHWDAFRTAGDTRLGTVGNVASLYGFWGEHEEWSTYFASTKQTPWLWLLSGAALAAIVVVGLTGGLRDRRTRAVVVGIFAVGCAALVFSVGVGDSIFRGLNMWLFENVGFWRGFRDTQKWSALLALTYSLLGGLGVTYIARYAEGLRPRRFIVLAVLFVACAFPFLYTPTLPFGLAGQIHPVMYPAAWAEVNAILKQDPECKAVFLPWHLYYELEFNDKHLTANPASKYFDCTIISSADAEIGGVGYPSGMSKEYESISEAMTSNMADPEDVIRILTNSDVHYIIFTADEDYRDTFRYPFLRTSSLKRVIDTPSIALYSVMGYDSHH